MKPILYFFRRIRLLTILCAILIFPLGIYAQTANTKSKEMFVSVRIILQDIALAKEATMKFEMCKDEINTSYSKDIKSYQYNITELATVFKVPLNSKINYGTISFNSSFFRKSYNTNDDLSSHPNLNKSLYIFESGDAISIYITADKVLFSGKGNEKYNCLTRLNGVDRSEVYKMGDVIPSEITKVKLIQAYFDKEQLFYQNKTDILTRYKNQLDTEIYSLISADLWGEYNDRLTNVLYSKSIPYRKRNTEWHDVVEAAYIDLSKTFITDKFNINTLAKSYRYCDFLYKRERFETILFTRPEAKIYNLNYTFKELFNRIQMKYKGLIYDKLVLSAFLTELKIRSDINLYFATAIAGMGRNNFKATMQQLANTITGSAFLFELPDENGKVYKLRDFKGKLLVMDFWFTGCSGCIILAEQMKPIIASYKENSDIVFITVCVDKDKQTWLKSLNDGKYTSPHELNLYTDGLATEHPIVKHYNITGFPFLLVISKDGKVISTAPPRPLKNSIDNNHAFKDYINQYL